MERVRRVLFDPAAVPAMVFLVALVAIGVMASPDFSASDNIGNILIQVTPLLLVAVGQTFAVATAGLDLSVGASVTLTSIVAVTYFPQVGVFAVVIALLVGLAIGAANGIGIMGGIHPFLATLATMSVVQGIAFVYRPGGPAGAVPDWFAELAGFWGPIPRALPVSLAVAVAAWVIFRQTRLGLNILAIGGDREVARLAGIRVSRTRIAAYVICALCAALAGVFIAARTRTGDPLIGNSLTLDSLAAVVLGGSLLAGGRATIAGTVAGVMCLGVLANALNFAGLDFYYQLPVKGALLILGVLLPALTIRLQTWQSRRRTGASLAMKSRAGETAGSASP